jgi:tetratricopeptide (TPR) repeat protein
MNKIKSLIVILALAASCTTLASSVNKEYQAQFNQAMTYIQNEEYNNAYPVLLAMNQSNSNSNNDFHLGLCTFYLQFDKSFALTYFDKAALNVAKNYKNTAENTQAPNEAIYFQGLCYHYLGQTDKAISKYEEYIRNAKSMSSDKLIVADAKRKLTIAKETPNLFTTAEHQQIVSNRSTEKKIGPEYKTKLAKVMSIVNEDKLEAMLILKEMLKEYPSEPNINYMMGVCMLNIKQYNDLSTDYFQVADKNSASFKACGIGLECPSFVKYFSGVANQIKGDHKQALADFEAFNAIYPEDYSGFKPEFIKRMEYSRNIVNTVGTNSLAVQNNKLNIIDTAGLQIIFPVMGTPIVTDNSNAATNQTQESGVYTSYYSVQVGAGNMMDSYFKKVTELRVAKYPSGMKRFVTGKFATKSEANSRLKELIDLGYSDAFVLRMRGKK